MIIGEVGALNAASPQCRPARSARCCAAAAARGMRKQGDRRKRADRAENTPVVMEIAPRPGRRPNATPRRSSAGGNAGDRVRPAHCATAATRITPEIAEPARSTATSARASRPVPDNALVYRIHRVVRAGQPVGGTANNAGRQAGLAYRHPDWDRRASKAKAAAFAQSSAAWRRTGTWQANAARARHQRAAPCSLSAAWAICSMPSTARIEPCSASASTITMRLFFTASMCCVTGSFFREFKLLAVVVGRAPAVRRAMIRMEDWPWQWFPNRRSRPLRPKEIHGIAQAQGLHHVAGHAFLARHVGIDGQIGAGEPQRGRDVLQLR